MSLEELKERVEKNTVGSELLAPKLEELESKLQEPSVWADQKLATEIGQRVREIKDKISLFEAWNAIIEDAQTAQEISNIKWDANANKFTADVKLVKDFPLTIWVSKPKGFNFVNATADIAKCDSKVENNAVKITLQST